MGINTGNKENERDDKICIQTIDVPDKRHRWWVKEEEDEMADVVD
jgi:hypothetical protein